MTCRIFVPLFGLFAFLASGCGPMAFPGSAMPMPLDPEQQRKIDKAWDDVLTPVDQYDRSTLFYLLLTTHAYQVGVDKLDFRSEKKFSGGLVVMEIHCNRTTPDSDSFSVEVRDHAGKVLRRESCGREIIVACRQELGEDLPNLEQKQKAGTITPEEQKKLKSLKAQMNAVMKVFEDVQADQKK